LLIDFDRRLIISDADFEKIRLVFALRVVVFLVCLHVSIYFSLLIGCVLKAATGRLTSAKQTGEITLGVVKVLSNFEFFACRN